MFDISWVREDVKRVLGNDTAAGGIRLFGQILSLALTDPLFFRILVLRHYQWAKKKGIPNLPLMRIANFRLKQFIEIDTLEIGKGLRIFHGDGIVIGEGAKIGNGLTIEHQVTIGNRVGHEGDLSYPVIGDNVFIGTGAKVLGAIRVGHNAKIGANAVVIHDVPDNATVVGIPAKVVRIAERSPAGEDAKSH